METLTLVFTIAGLVAAVLVLAGLVLLALGYWHDRRYRLLERADAQVRELVCADLGRELRVDSHWFSEERAAALLLQLIGESMIHHRSIPAVSDLRDDWRRAIAPLQEERSRIRKERDDLAGQVAAFAAKVREADAAVADDRDLIRSSRERIKYLETVCFRAAQNMVVDAAQEIPEDESTIASLPARARALALRYEGPSR